MNRTTQKKKGRSGQQSTPAHTEAASTKVEICSRMLPSEMKQMMMATVFTPPDLHCCRSMTPRLKTLAITPGTSRRAVPHSFTSAAPNMVAEARRRWVLLHSSRLWSRMACPGSSHRKLKYPACKCVPPQVTSECCCM